MVQPTLTEPRLRGKKTVVVGVYPGQGEQNIRMLDGFGQNRSTRRVLEEATEVLANDPVAISQSEEMLQRTEWIQPLTVLSSVALTEAMRETPELAPDIVTGHSLGEYSALVASGAMMPAQGISLAHERGRVSGEVLQQEDNDGAMAAVSGMTPDQVDATCASIQDIWAANYNSDEQVVISGKKMALTSFVRVASTLYPNLKIRIKELDIRGAFHSPMVELAGRKLQPSIMRAKIFDAKTPLFSPTTVEWVRSTGEIRRVLADQFTGQVRFVQTVRRIGAICAAEEVEDVVFVQVGPDKSDAKVASVRDLGKGVLLNLVQRIWSRNDQRTSPQLHVQRVSLPQDVEALAERIQKIRSG